ncbi:MULTISPECIES: ABC transporter ATP-binding protein [unclassified Bacillus (in: firmicutes)]|uniref:ABC transporter ATP-binding protein n=1 Tax=unclassified Bacillus (in: firmicutes) TaxID=185979 RepID=UPI0008ED545D|nr:MULTISPECIES: ABC transporter ATP-binding protein [unclassified Bacillus (in: firmicutes)]SFI06702.1 amino acid/amide ABC transporter ATP-binding protein 1, HAAT family [Bacillus sp. 71mf]SFS78658.1 amino acid/amide ABC transporter ATP-binding protein 1, HAAT family [Bacillus sp. 103mf]
MEKLLETRNLCVSFGEHHVIKDVNLVISKGKFISIIGPNGAGKTTLFNLLSGQLSPTKGEVYFKERDITKLSIPDRASLGMGRSFQLTNIFPELTVLENVRLSVQSYAKDYYRFFPRPSRYKQQQEEARHLLEAVLLNEKEEVLAKDLAHGEKRKLELAMLLALKTDLLLLDEPTAGISIEEVPAILQVIENIKNDRKKTIVLIEHKMDMVLRLSDHLVVLFQGELLAEGLPEEIMKDERVQTAYLGGLYSDTIKSG